MNTNPFFMQGRDARGRQVSLLNDDGNSNSKSCRDSNVNTCTSGNSNSGQMNPCHRQHQSFPLPSAEHVFGQLNNHHNPYQMPRRRRSPPPDPPGLLRSNSFDSQMSTDPMSPLTPCLDVNCTKTSIFPAGQDGGLEGPPLKRPSHTDRSRTGYEDGPLAAAAPVLMREDKKYPCRYRDSHSCDKMFTTSGHASRHSKIHTAEKAVKCTYEGCPKKFTRNDNMKQHLDTHYKEKTRTSSSDAHRVNKSASATARRNATPSGRRRSSTTPRAQSAVGLQPAEHGENSYRPLLSPATTFSATLRSRASGESLRSVWWDRLRSIGQGHDGAGMQQPRNGLDTLALAVEHQRVADHVVSRTSDDGETQGNK